MTIKHVTTGEVSTSKRRILCQHLIQWAMSITVFLQSCRKSIACNVRGAFHFRIGY